MALFLVVARELLLVELIVGPEVLPEVLVDVPLFLPRAPLTVLWAVFVALLTLLVRDCGPLLRELEALFRLRLDPLLVDEALFLMMLADLAPLDTLAVLPLLLPRLPRLPRLPLLHLLLRLLRLSLLE